MSFRALDIEQIGHVYEGLLDHTAKRAKEPCLGLLGTKDKEPEVPLAELEAAHGPRARRTCSQFLKEQTGRSGAALAEGTGRRPLEADGGLDVPGRLRQRREALEAGPSVRRAWCARDTFDYPVVIPPGSVYVTGAPTAAQSGTHYTPRSLTEPIVQYTLEPLVYVGPAEGKPKEEWQLRPAKELLDLKICDMACGSGAFLVQACRYLAERLLEAWDEAEKHGTQGGCRVPCRRTRPRTALGLASRPTASRRWAGCTSGSCPRT